MTEKIETRRMLVVGAHDVPWQPRRMGTPQHLVAGPRVFRPALYRDLVDRAGLPLAQGVTAPLLEPMRLLLAVDVEIIFEQPDAGVDQHPLEDRSVVEKSLRLVFGAKPHNPLHSGAVVPGAIE